MGRLIARLIGLTGCVGLLWLWPGGWRLEWLALAVFMLALAWPIGPGAWRRVAIAAALFGVMFWVGDAKLTVIWLPVAIMLALASLFAKTLFEGEPLVARFARSVEPAHTQHPKFARYTWWATLFWALFLVLMAMVSAWIAMLDSPIGLGLLPFAAIALAGVIEFRWRQRVMPDVEHGTLANFLKVMARVDWRQAWR